ncbi:MAG: plasmid pRiA4b ORF-3 family protein [Thermodesulfobacteriota bacterium]|nr:plasmid pRiA4b ORF-3 family protein [Thermodesulfobacteriota bacterium]
MEKAFKKVYQFKVTLKGIRQPIWRRIQVLDNYTFWDLHVAVQDAMGWLDYHLHAFHILNPETGLKEEIGGIDDSSWDDHQVTPGWERNISRYFTPENNKALYVYDFGDDWQHDVKLEKVLPWEKNVKYPICIAGKRACPPEDCGGVWGYMDLLEILSNPNHEDFEDTLEWLGEEFDPDYFDSGEIVFSDPQERWEYAFGSTDDFSDDEIDDIEEALNEGRAQMRAFSRDYMHGIWEKAKNGDMEGLSPEDMQLAQIMKDHEDEFFNQFEFSDLTYDHEYDPDTEVNPFLHVYLHSIVENQLSEKDPIEVFQFYNAMRKKKCSHHDSVHMIGAILAPLMFSVFEKQRPFDIDTYKHLLKKYKTRNPDKLFDLLDKESSLYPSDS